MSVQDSEATLNRSLRSPVHLKRTLNNNPDPMQSLYGKDYMDWDVRQTKRGIVSQHEHARLDDFDQKMPNTTYTDDFIPFMESSTGRGRLSPRTARSGKGTSAIAEAAASNLLTSTYQRDFLKVDEEASRQARAAIALAKPIDFTSAPLPATDASVNKYMLTSMYQSDFPNHADTIRAAQEAAAAAEAGASSSSSRGTTTTTKGRGSFSPPPSHGARGTSADFGKSFERYSLAEQTLLRGQSVKPRHAAAGGLPGYPQLRARDSAEAQALVKASAFKSTYDRDFR